MDRQLLKSRIWRIMRPDIGGIILMMLLYALSACFGVSFALVSRQLLDIAVGDAEGDLLLFSGVLIGMLLVQVSLDFASMYIGDRVSGRINMRLKEMVFGSLFQKQWRDISRYHSGELVSRLMGDSRVIVSTISSVLPRTVSFIVRLVACVAVLFSLDWRFTLALLIAAGAVLLFYRLYGKKAKDMHIACREADGAAMSYMQESVENWMVIRSFDGNQTVRQRLGSLLKTHYRAVLHRARWSHISSLALRLVFSGSYYVALAWGALQLSAGAITYGTLMAFLQIVMQLRNPMVNMSGIGAQYFNMLASAERLFVLVDLEDEPLPMASARQLYEDLQEIRLQDVCFGYDADHPVLNNTSVTIRKGDFVALSGFSGIGKSTLFKLMLGFYKPDSGCIEAVLSEYNKPLGADTRGLFAYVPQQNMLLSGTVRENISFFSDAVTDEQLWMAAEIADMADAIREMPQGMDTPLGERGAGLSEGQLQRLAIARAVISGAPILLLDEATSALDEQTEARVLRNLRSLTDRTCLFISHRAAALEVCDHVIHIEEDGSFHMD